MEKKPFYYDGSGDGEKLIQLEVVKKHMSIVTEVRKNLTGNPYVIDWSQVNVVGKRFVICVYSFLIKNELKNDQ
ncbi:hypothetical protein [Gottfriedia acidiceleris]|uniref:hypothetical protein n=1 Tax=Gottfriedia acidiceleris TaxID=371036 RepID=UPI002FFEEE10